MTTKKLLQVMKLFSWLAFIGLCIKTGAVLFSYFISLGNPEASKNIFGTINLYDFYNHSFLQYSFILFYKVLFFGLEAYIAFLIVQLLSKLDIQNPFNLYIAQRMKQLSWSIGILWIIAMIHNTHMQIVGAKYGLVMNLFSSDFIFLAGVIFIFTKIVQRGIEIKTENDLTI